MKKLICAEEIAKCHLTLSTHEICFARNASGDIEQVGVNPNGVRAIIKTSKCSRENLGDNKCGN